MNELPIESFEDLPEDALCIICQMPSTDNVNMCMTGHNACRSCADKWLRSNNENSDKCASCRKPLMRPHMPGTGNTWMTNTALNNLVDTFHIKCPNVRGGCTHTCKLMDMADHVKNCEWREISCKCSGCAWKGPACKWSDHMREEDHGKYLVDMMLFTQQVCATMCDKFDGAEEERKKLEGDVKTLGDSLKTQIGCVGTSVEAARDTLRVVETHTNKHDGSSVRSKQRDRKNQKDVDSAKAAQEEAEKERDDLKRKLDEAQASDNSLTEWERGRYEAMQRDLRELPDIEQWKTTKRSRDRFFRERDEARHLARTAQERIHDQHNMLVKMMPRAMGPCPCTLDTCRYGGGRHNEHVFMRGLVRRELEE
tara:strand:+ start:3606 stop:4706 length:1101 start_codon:yes stop_codon:yes gene_type:complete